MIARLMADYRYFVALVRRKDGFWPEARELAEAAYAYRDVKF